MNNCPEGALTNGVLKDGDCGPHGPGFLFHGRPHPGGPGCLTSAPQAETARPAARVFFAALISRSCRVPQDGHCHARVLSGSSASRCPQAEQVLLLG